MQMVNLQAAKDIGKCLGIDSKLEMIYMEFLLNYDGGKMKLDELRKKRFSKRAVAYLASAPFSSCPNKQVPEHGGEPKCSIDMNIAVREFYLSRYFLNNMFIFQYFCVKLWI